jgi:hypothetical protein
MFETMMTAIGQVSELSQAEAQIAQLRADRLEAAEMVTEAKASGSAADLRAALDIYQDVIRQQEAAETAYRGTVTGARQTVAAAKKVVKTAKWYVVTVRPDRRGTSLYKSVGTTGYDTKEAAAEAASRMMSLNGNGFSGYYTTVKGK